MARLAETTMRTWTEAELWAEREQVLPMWSSGSGLGDLSEIIAYRRQLPESKSMVALIRRAEAEGRCIVTPRAGVALLDEQIGLLQALQNEGGADFLPSTIDSHTRHNRYSEVDALIKESERTGRSMLNGFPVVNWGVAGTRRLVESVDRPVIPNYSAFDGRLIAEISLAGGFAGIIGSPMNHILCYSRNDAIPDVIHHWQYVDRLTAFYQSLGFEMLRGMPAYAIGSVIPPSSSVVATCVDAMISAAQGAININLMTRHVGSVLQDVAGIRVQEKIAREYCGHIGCPNVKITTEFNQWCGEFPLDEAQATALICAGATIGMLGGARLINVKTPDEGWGLPTREANVKAVRLVRYLATLFRGQQYPDSPALAQEMEMIEMEARAILDAILDLGDGDLALGLPRALEAGVADWPYTPNRFIRSLCMSARDLSGAVRWADTGNLPFPKRVLDYNRSCMESRIASEGQKPAYEIVLDDALAGIMNCAGLN